MKIMAFFKKDLLAESSYRLNLFFNAFGVVASLLTYFFIDKLFGRNMTPGLSEFGVSYFSYVLVGMAFFSYVGAGIGSFSSRLQTEQDQGTLEAIVMAPCKLYIFLVSLAAWNLAVATLDLAVYALAGALLFKVDFSHINLISTAVVLVFTVVSFSSLGIISASFVLLFKRGNPLAWVISNLEGVLGGVYFPIAIMPQWLQALAHILPITYAIRAIQLAVYKGYGVTALWRELAFLAAFSCVLLPVSVAAFKYALDRARKTGSLSQY